MAAQNLDNIGSGNGLLLVDEISKEMLQVTLLNMKISNLRLQPH